MKKKKEKPMVIGVGSELEGDLSIRDIADMFIDIFGIECVDPDGSPNIGKAYEKILKNKSFSIKDDDRKMLEKIVRKYKLKNLKNNE